MVANRRPRPTAIRETVDEIAARIGRPVTTIRNTWARHPEWPAPVGKRGRWNEYDRRAVDDWISRNVKRQAVELEPDRLYTAQQLEDAGVGVSATTIRADLSRSRKGGPRRWPEPDDTTGGVNRWYGRTAAAALANRRGYRKKGQ